MIKYYKSVNESLDCFENYEDGVWINMVNPTEEEIYFICKNAHVDPRIYKAGAG